MEEEVTTGNPAEEPGGKEAKGKTGGHLATSLTEEPGSKEDKGRTRGRFLQSFKSIRNKFSRSKYK